MDLLHLSLFLPATVILHHIGSSGDIGLLTNFLEYKDTRGSIIYSILAQH